MAFPYRVRIVKSAKSSRKISLYLHAFHVNITTSRNLVMLICIACQFTKFTDMYIRFTDCVDLRNALDLGKMTCIASRFIKSAHYCYIRAFHALIYE